MGQHTRHADTLGGVGHLQAGTGGDRGPGGRGRGWAGGVVCVRRGRHLDSVTGPLQSVTGPPDRAGRVTAKCDQASAKCDRASAKCDWPV